jgi:aspartate beta-hydroxylase
MNQARDAQNLLRQGRVAEAEAAYARLLESAPDDLEALNVLGLGALQRRELGRARTLFERAVAHHGADGLSRYHLGRVFDESGDTSAALEAYGAAVRLNPALLPARLYLGAALNRAGERDLAAVQYCRVLDEAQKQGRWLDPSSTPASLRPLVEQAVIVVRDTRRALCARLLEPLRQRFGHDELRRVEQAVRIHLRIEAPTYPDARQQPTFFYLPGLPATPYLDRRLFPWIEALESQTDDIRAELERLLPSAAGRERVFGSEELERANLRGAAQPPSWNGYYFYRHGERRADNCAACPVTAAALEQVSLCRVREHGPEVLYSVFTPGTHLLPHRGVTNTRLVAHLPLIIPEDCALNVGGELHAWQPGRVVVFDDTYEHEAWNRSSSIRVVLILDVWNPHMSEAERLATAELVAAMGDFRRAVEQA